MGASLEGQKQYKELGGEASSILSKPKSPPQIKQGYAYIKCGSAPFTGVKHEVYGGICDGYRVLNYENSYLRFPRFIQTGITTRDVGGMDLRNDGTFHLKCICTIVGCANWSRYTSRRDVVLVNGLVYWGTFSSISQFRQHWPRSLFLREFLFFNKFFPLRYFFALLISAI